MEMKNNRGFLLIILILGGLVSFSQLKRFNSSKQQYEMQFDLEQDRFSRPINFVEKIETNYPNLTYLGVPLSALKASYYASLDSIDLAKKLVDEAIKSGADCVKFQMRNMKYLYRSSNI